MGSGRQEANTQGWNGFGKRHKMEQTVYRISQTTTNNGFSLRALQATTTSAPLPRGDALVAYENLKREKKCDGRKSGCEMILDIKVVSG